MQHSAVESWILVALALFSVPSLRSTCAACLMSTSIKPAPVTQPGGMKLSRDRLPRISNTALSNKGLNIASVSNAIYPGPHERLSPAEFLANSCASPLFPGTHTHLHELGSRTSPAPRHAVCDVQPSLRQTSPPSPFYLAMVFRQRLASILRAGFGGPRNRIDPQLEPQFRGCMIVAVGCPRVPPILLGSWEPLAEGWCCHEWTSMMQGADRVWLGHVRYREFILKTTFRIP